MKARLLLAGFLLVFPVVAHSATGIIEIYSDPAGARVYLDNTYVGKTPYQNIEISTGKHRIRVELNKDYPEQTWDVVVDPITPQTKTFYFRGGGGGKFTGSEMEQATEKFKGSVQFASIPTGATVFINGDQKKKTPLGYTDVPVGRYTVKFLKDGKTLQGTFDIIKDEVVKIIGDYSQGRIINKWEEEQEAQRQEALRLERAQMAEQARRDQLQRDNEQLQREEEARRQIEQQRRERKEEQVKQRRNNLYSKLKSLLNTVPTQYSFRKFSQSEVTGYIDKFINDGKGVYNGKPRLENLVDELMNKGRGYSDIKYGSGGTWYIKLNADIIADQLSVNITEGSDGPWHSDGTKLKFGPLSISEAN